MDRPTFEPPTDPLSLAALGLATLLTEHPDVHPWTVSELRVYGMGHGPDHMLVAGDVILGAVARLAVPAGAR